MDKTKLKRIPKKILLIGAGLFAILCLCFAVAIAGLPRRAEKIQGIAEAETPILQAALVEPSQTKAPSITPSTTPFPSATSLPTGTPTPTSTPTIPASVTPSMTSLPSDTLEPTPTSDPILERFPCIPAGPKMEGKVVKVVDGDTIRVDIAGEVKPVRYIGIDSPEIDQHGGSDALEGNKDLVAGETVYLYKDQSEQDKIDRLLRYVVVGDLFVNYDLVRQGYAAPVSYPPDTACDTFFQGAVPATPSPEVPSAPQVEIINIFYNGEKGQTEPDEYVELQNNGEQAVQLEGWTLLDKANHKFIFPTFEMQPGQVCRVYTNEDHPDSCGFSFHFDETAIWNNGGDCAYLIDGDGNEVGEYCY